MSQKIEVPVNVYIRQEKDYLIRCYKDTLFKCEGEEEPDYDIWSNGRSCDCERAQFFFKIDEDASDDFGCGEEYFRIRITNLDGGIVYDEWEEK